MANAEICQGLEVSDMPIVSLNSLMALWNILHPGQENGSFSRTPSVAEGEGHEEQRNRIPTGVSIQERRDLEPAAGKGTGEGLGPLRPDGNGTVPAGRKGGENG